MKPKNSTSCISSAKSKTSLKLSARCAFSIERSTCSTINIPMKEPACSPYTVARVSLRLVRFQYSVVIPELQPTSIEPLACKHGPKYPKDREAREPLLVFRIGSQNTSSRPGVPMTSEFFTLCRPSSWPMIGEPHLCRLVSSG